MNQVDVTIMGQVYKLACKEDEQAALLQAAAYLDQKMCHFRENAKIKGADKIAVMAALTIAAELLAIKVSDGPLAGASVGEVSTQIQHMNKTLDEVLTLQEDLF